jgi:hypothetical protein
MTAAIFAAGLAVAAFHVFLIVACIWAYRRFRLPSLPWLLGYLLLGEVVALFTVHVAKRVIDKASASGITPLGAGFTLSEFLKLIQAASSIFDTAGHALIAWFILSELAFAYSKTASTEALPAIITLPRRHSSALGTALLVCVVVMPVFWLALLASK